jgi:hypothetical protein
VGFTVWFGFPRTLKLAVEEASMIRQCHSRFSHFLISFGVPCTGIFFLVGLVIGYLLWDTDLGKPQFTWEPDNASKIHLVKVGCSKSELIRLLGKPDEQSSRADTIHESFLQAPHDLTQQRVLIRANLDWVNSHGSATEVWNYNVGPNTGYSVDMKDGSVCGKPSGYDVTF